MTRRKIRYSILFSDHRLFLSFYIVFIEVFLFFIVKELPLGFFRICKVILFITEF